MHCVRPLYIATPSQVTSKANNSADIDKAVTGRTDTRWLTLDPDGQVQHNTNKRISQTRMLTKG